MDVSRSYSPHADGENAQVIEPRSLDFAQVALWRYEADELPASEYGSTTTAEMLYVLSGDSRIVVPNH
jgi:hypothetical protein